MTADDMAIFSDNASRIDMCRQVIRHHARLVFGFLGAFLILSIFLTIAFPQATIFRGALAGATIGSCFSGMLIGNQFKRLNHMIRQMESPLA